MSCWTQSEFQKDGIKAFKLEQMKGTLDQKHKNTVYKTAVLCPQRAKLN